jgi:hypothetical protein
VLYWLLSFLKPGFRHVFAMRPTGPGDGWLIANWHSGRLDLIEAAGPVDVGPRRFADYGAFVAAMAAAGLATTLAVTTGEGRTWRVRGPATCVTAAKHLIGIAAPLAVTPWGLYRHLTAGGRPGAEDADGEDAP